MLFFLHKIGKKVSYLPILYKKNSNLIILLLAQSSISKPVRAKSVGREKTDDEMPKPLSAPKKPVPPPKSKEVLARAKSHPVPTKDNLRKVIIFLSFKKNT